VPPHDNLHVGVRQHLREKLLQVEHFDAGFGERVGEGVVLLVRPSHPEDIVEAQLVLVAGVSRLSSRSGRCSRTRRSGPTSESTKSRGAGLAARPGLSTSCSRKLIGPSSCRPEPDAIHDQRSPFSCSGALPAPSPRTLVQALTEVTIVVASPAAMRTSLAVVVDAP
jgi:hypothetical protein